MADVTLTIGADATQAKSELDALKQTFNNLGTAIKNPTATMTSLATSFVAGYATMSAVTTAGRALVGFLADSVKEFADAEAGSKKLDVALRQQGNTLPSTRAHFDALAKELQRTTVFSDDLITEMQALFVQVGNVGPAQMKKALNAAADLSVGVGIDLRSATMLVAKAFSGGADDLGRLTQYIKATLPEGASLEQVLEAINAQYGGQATGQLGTYTGQVAQLGNAWSDLKEATGKMLSETGILSTVMMAMRVEVAKTQSSVSTLNQIEKARTAGIPAHIAGLFQLFGSQKDVNAAMKASVPPVEAARDKMEELRTEASALKAKGMTPLSEAQRQLARDFADGGMAAGDIAKKLAVSSAAVSKLLNDEKSASAETTKLTEAFQKQVDVLTGQSLAAKVADLNRQVIAAGQQGGLTAFEYAKLGKELSSLHSEGATLPNALHRIWLEHERLNPSIAVTTDVYNSFVALLKAAPQVVTGVQKPIAVLQQEMARLISTNPAAMLAGVGTIVGGLTTPFQGALDRARALSGGIEVMSNQGASAAQVMDEYGAAAVAAARDLVRLGGSVDMLPPKLREVVEEAEKADRAMQWANRLQNASDLVSSFATNVVGKFSKTGASAVQVGADVLSLGASFAAGDWMAVATKGLKLVGQALEKIFGSAGRDLVKEYASSKGGFDALREKMLTLEGGGEALWTALTQGVGKNNPEQARAAIKAIEDAFEKAGKAADAFVGPDGARGFPTKAQLDKAAAEAGAAYAYMRDSGQYTAGVLKDAWQTWQDALVTAGDVGAASLKKIDAEIKSLQQSIASEAPEEVMGAIETVERARLAALEAERVAALASIASQADATALAASATQTSADRSYLHTAGKARELDGYLRDLFSRGYSIPITVSASGGSGSSGGSEGVPAFSKGSDGIRDFGAGTLAMLHGREGVFTAAQISTIVNSAGRASRMPSFARGALDAAPSIIINAPVDASGSMFQDRRAMTDLAEIVSERIAAKYRGSFPVGVR